METDIYRSLEESTSLPTLPAIATDVVRISRRTEIDLTELTRVVEQDPAIATKLMRTARSPVYLTRGAAPTTTSSVNEKFGRDVGDAVLQAVGRVVARCVRQLDVAARYGGEEFAIILPATDRAGAKIAADRLRKLLEKQDVLIGGGRAINVTASFGVATMDESFVVQARAELLRATDAYLYAAKRGGRNRVVARE